MSQNRMSRLDNLRNHLDLQTILVSWYLLRFVNLERYKLSFAGWYLRTFMTHTSYLGLTVGMALMMFGAWYHVWLWLLLGWLLILVAWGKGLSYWRRTSGWRRLAYHLAVLEQRALHLAERLDGWEDVSDPDLSSQENQGQKPKQAEDSPEQTTSPDQE
jgi:hypothetical protein